VAMVACFKNWQQHGFRTSFSHIIITSAGRY